jgi:hypothetical protein
MRASFICTCACLRECMGTRIVFCNFGITSLIFTQILLTFMPFEALCKFIKSVSFGVGEKLSCAHCRVLK